MKKSQKTKWLRIPEEHDYPAAASYLNLIFDKEITDEMIVNLKNTNVQNYKAKDLFRASSLSLLGISNSHVEKDLQKIKSKKKLSPLLLIRNTKNSKLIIADGYHRLCAVH